jgi:hypothetical protein
MSADLAHCFVAGDQCVGDLRDMPALKARWRVHFRSGGVSNRFRPKSCLTRCAAGDFSQIPQPLLGVREADAMAAERCAMGGPSVAASSRRYRPCRACHSIVAPDGSPLVSSERKAIEVADLIGSELRPDFHGSRRVVEIEARPIREWRSPDPVPKCRPRTTACAVMQLKRGRRGGQMLDHASANDFAARCNGRERPARRYRPRWRCRSERRISRRTPIR